ncbi:MAG: peptidylprolyl isomerase [Bacteroidota bacterium]
MKKRMLSLVLVVMTTLGLFSQESPVLMTIADEDVTLAEFERIYKKNNNDNSLNKQTPEEYLELFINFKLKVKEAEALGMDTTSKFINELAGYRDQLAKPYLADEETREEMMKEAYERSKTDINASHILIRLPSNATPEDTLAAYEKIVAIRDRIVGGESFETVARATSDDGSVSRNGGNLGYFTVFSMIYEFENVAYNTPIGKVSLPFRTSYGYHILNVHDRRPARGQVKVAHIFVRTPEEMTEAQKSVASAKAQMIYDSLQAGVDFAHLARTYSEDPNSAKNGGEMPWFGSGRMIPVFENAAFSIENKGDFAEPFKSFYGWHIVKLLDKKGIGTYEEMKPDLQEKANRGDRRKYQSVKYVNKLKTEYGFTEFPEGLELVYNNTDTTLLEGAWSGGELTGNSTPIMKIGKRTVTTGDFVKYVTEKQGKGKSGHVQSYVNQLYDEFTKESVIGYEDSMLAEKYPEFRYIYEEYHDGILLFDIMDQKVWSKAVSDTLGLEGFHKNHKKDYMWQQRSDAIVITCGEDADMEGVRKAYKKILKGKRDEADLNSEFCTNDTVDCISLEKILVEEGENELVDAMKGQTGLGPVVKGEDSNSFVILRKMTSPEPKALDEARGQITSDYQDYLEKAWIEGLKQKYPVEVDKALLSRIKS